MSGPLELIGVGRSIETSNAFSQLEIEGEHTLRIAAGARTDWFTDPAGAYTTATSPVLWFRPPDGDFCFGATVSAELRATFDAAGLVIRCGSSWWAKLVHELSPQGAPMIVSVVSSPSSDDANGSEVARDAVQLRLTRKASTLAMHWRTDGAPWSLVRYCGLPAEGELAVGLTVQSPTGEGCSASIAGCFSTVRVPDDVRSGD